MERRSFFKLAGLSAAVLAVGGTLDAWDADTEYEGWQWWLARSEGGAWTLLTWGY